mgnify:CR=1 FL=1
MADANKPAATAEVTQPTTTTAPTTKSPRTSDNQQPTTTVSKQRRPADGSPVPQGSRILYHCGTPGCTTRTSLHLLAFSTKVMRPLCSNPSCVKYELKTFYCPQTLLPSTDSFQDAKKNRSGKAFCCPQCQSALSVHKGSSSEEDGSGDFHFRCPYCRWTSLPNLHDISHKMLGDSAMHLEQNQTLDSKFSDAVDQTSQAHEQWANNAARRASSGETSTRTGGASDTRAILARLRTLTTVRATSPRRYDGSPRHLRSGDGPSKSTKISWQNMEDRRRAEETARPQTMLNVPLVDQQHDPREADPVDESRTIDEFVSRQQTREHCMNHCGSGDTEVGQSAAALHPLRQPLRVKKAVRCLASQKILIQANVNPQQGDSNFGRNANARWFEMEEFASEYMPRMFLYRVTARDADDGSDSVVVSIVTEIRKPRAIFNDEIPVLLTITARDDAVEGVVLDLPPATLKLTKTPGTTADQTKATTDPANARYVVQCADGAVLLRMHAVVPVSGPVIFPLAIHVVYPLKYKGTDTVDFTYNVDIDTVAP